MTRKKDDDKIKKLVKELTSDKSPITLTGTAGTGKTAFLKAMTKNNAAREAAVREEIKRGFTSSRPGEIYLTTSEEPFQPSDAFAKRFAAIKIEPLSLQLREEMILKVVQADRLKLAAGVTEKKLSATLKQKAFKDASIRDTIALLKKKGLVTEQKKPGAPKPS